MHRGIREFGQGKAAQGQVEGRIGGVVHAPQMVEGVGVTSLAQRGEPARELYRGQHGTGSDGQGHLLGRHREALHTTLFAA